MSWIDFVRYAGALLFVLGLVGLAGLATRRFQLSAFIKRESTRRLAIVESVLIAPRQRLLLVRRDGVEHLVLSTADGAVIVESGISREAP